ncbi:MAG: hypothetical protein KAJ93_00500 [Methanosarcinales archaeon]|nr:hypothetical protein [Methanosarcinales archaeon]
MQVLEHKKYAGKLNRVVTLVRENQICVGIVNTGNGGYSLDEYEPIRISFFERLKGVELEDKYWQLVRKWGGYCDGRNSKNEGLNHRADR